uniref:Uncharacterized protein n=1 Tax=Pyxicephalus adspersus TaxID=30357 RepID=A0AAV3APG1_PYXAD|nr:TPA: hypothetical protein GDO54_011111 [Pyxicephalus adspersus]
MHLTLFYRHVPSTQKRTDFLWFFIFFPSSYLFRSVIKKAFKEMLSLCSIRVKRLTRSSDTFSSLSQLLTLLHLAVMILGMLVAWL